ncbi:MAG: two-component system response regulator [Spirochaetes bacterium]|nr:MAG: two-component system response regulator [Spirochaetota bacterium]
MIDLFLKDRGEVTLGGALIMKKRRILVVDDSRACRKLVKGLLASLNANLEEASNGREALDMVLENRFDLIITDVDMPEMDGVELCKNIKSFPPLRYIPIIMVSSFDSDKDVSRGFEAGASEYVSKKTVRENLYERVKSVLKESDFARDKTILVVDDSHSIRLMLREGLSMSGFGVVTAKNGEEALEILRKVKIDLILSDIHMPVMNGITLCRKVHEDPLINTIPFIVMSTDRDRSLMKKLHSLGSDTYIVKPFNMDSLTILIGKLLSDHYLLLLKEKEQLEMERNMMLASISSLILALEAKDNYTKGHSENVSAIASGMVSLTGADKDEIEVVRLGGILHDIGKIGVRDSILLKKGRLSEEEKLEIMKHPRVGFNIIKPIPSLGEVTSLILYHHERFDGKGYPEGLKGSDIPFWARIMAVADTFDALTSNRPYRSGYTEEEAYEIIHESRGTQLCPDAVDLFFQWISDQKTKKRIDKPEEKILK